MHELDSRLTVECVLSVRTACWALRWDRAPLTGIGGTWPQNPATSAESLERSWIRCATRRLSCGTVSRRCLQLWQECVCVWPAAVLYDYDLLNENDEIGRVSIPVRDLTNGEEVERWIEIKQPQKPKADGGLVRLQMACVSPKQHSAAW